MSSQRTNFGHRLFGNSGHVVSYTPCLPYVYEEPVPPSDGRGTTSGSSQPLLTAFPERAGGRRHTPTQVRSRSGIVERGRSTRSSRRTTIYRSIFVGATILAVAGVTVLVLGAIEAFSPSYTPVNRGALLMLVGSSVLVVPAAMCTVLSLTKRPAPVRFEPRVPTV
ncbi:hypothetical protein MTO96_043108 [Rhipicephalus appendiculatus]